MTSARSVSSISSATSNGYRHPSQWFVILSRRINYSMFYFRSLRPDESPQFDQPSSFDILDFCYTILLGTFDLLRRLTVKDCLHICLQLNNSICEIIDLFVKHNYGIMTVFKTKQKNSSFFFYSFLF